MNWTNEITQLLAIDYPIIQAPMFGVTTPEMVAEASNINCLGSLALGDLDAEKCIELIRKTKQLTNNPFAVNIFVHTIPEITAALKSEYKKTKAFLEDLALQNGFEIQVPALEDYKCKSYHEQIDAIIAENCKIVSFTFGNLDTESIEKLKINNSILIGTCTSVSEAVVLEKSGIDIICVQGLEAGGHRGSFVSDNIPEIGGLSLLTQVSETIKTPIIYAGGIYNNKTLVASKILGASGFQIGSLLVGSAESALQNFEKERLRKSKESDIVLTNSFSGRYARGLKNTFVEQMEQANLILPYPYQNKITGAMRQVAKQNKNADFVNLWIGQSNYELSDAKTSNIIKKLIDEVENFNR